MNFETRNQSTGKGADIQFAKFPQSSKNVAIIRKFKRRETIKPVARRKQTENRIRFEDQVKEDELVTSSKQQYSFDKDEFSKRIQDINAYHIPDFGYKDNCLWDEISGIISPTTLKQKSNWKIFYDAIKKYPKFEMLKNYIDEAQKVKQTKEEEAKKNTLNQYIQKKQSQKFQTVQWQLDNQKAAEERAASSNQQSLSQSQNNIKLQEIKQLMVNMSEKFEQQQVNLTKIKRFINYRPPIKDKEIIDKSLIQSKVDHHWKNNDQTPIDYHTLMVKEKIPHQFNQAKNDDIKQVIEQKDVQRHSVRFGQNNQLSSTMTSCEKQNPNKSQTLKFRVSSASRSIDFEKYYNFQTSLAEKLLNHAIERLKFYEDLYQQELIQMSSSSNLSKAEMKPLKRKLKWLQQTSLALLEKQFNFLSPEFLAQHYESSKNDELTLTVFPLLLTLKKFFSVGKLELSYKRIICKKLQQYSRCIFSGQQQFTEKGTFFSNFGRSNLELSSEFKSGVRLDLTKQRPFSQEISRKSRLRQVFSQNGGPQIQSGTNGTQSSLLSGQNSPMSLKCVEKPSNQMADVQINQTVQIVGKPKNITALIDEGSAVSDYLRGADPQKAQHYRARSNAQTSLNHSMHIKNESRKNTIRKYLKIRNPYDLRYTSLEMNSIMPQYQIGMKIDKKIQKQKKASQTREDNTKKLISLMYGSL